MGHRTLSFQLVVRALFLDRAAYDLLRDDDNPFIEGAVLVVLIGFVTALLALVGQIIAWASVPNLESIKQTVLQNLQTMPWWSFIDAAPQARDQFFRLWDLGWQIFPMLFGAPNPAAAAANLAIWPVQAIIGWLIYGVLAYLFARALHGTGSLNQTLGTTALAATPLLLRGLGLVPFLAIGGMIGTWQLICRYRAVRSAHGLPVWRAFWATILPFAVYVLAFLLLALGGILVASSLVGR